MNLEENRRAFPIPHQLADELAGGLENLIVCTGTKDFGPIYPGNEELGGFYFSYPRRFAKNRSNLARILALKNGKRRIEWYNQGTGCGCHQPSCWRRPTPFHRPIGSPSGGSTPPARYARRG